MDNIEMGKIDIDDLEQIAGGKNGPACEAFEQYLHKMQEKYGPNNVNHLYMSKEEMKTFKGLLNEARREINKK